MTSLEAMMERMYVSVTILNLVVKVIIIIVKRNQLRVVLDYIEADIFYPKNPSYLKHIRYGSNINTKCIKFLSITATITATLVLVLPIVKNFTGDFEYRSNFPLHLWYPFEINNFVIYLMVYIYQSMAIISILLVSVAIDTMVFGLLAVAVSQLKILNNILKEMTDWDEVNKPSIKRFKNFQENSPVDEQECCCKLAQCAEHYNTIAKFCKRLENIYKFPLFVQIITDAVASCVIAFQMSTVSIFKNFGRFTMYMSFFAALKIDIFTACWLGNEIKLQSYDLHNSLYECKWYNCSNKLKRSFLVFIESTKKPIEIKVGMYMPLTLKLFVLLVNWSYSLFAMFNVLSRKN
ncbi:odorant receptor 46a-like [Arctopsyche grandis]|uniref:odorant receptor 46a-like n=1 Tax=Arctopsyche grandis TaxID=121162 RepID=UPI00406D699B